MLLHQLFEGANEATAPGTYAGVRFDRDTVENLQKLQEKLGVPDPLAPEDFHSTLLYSTKPCPNYVPLGELTPVATSDDYEFRLEIWPSNSGKKNVLVLKYDCEWLTNRHNTLMEEHDATWDHPDYIPHITLSYNVGDWTPKDDTVSFRSKRAIAIKEEYREELNKDW